MTLTVDRRTTRRLHRVDEHGIVAARVRPGHRAHLVDVSATGALIETSYRLLPGTSVELHVETETTHTRIRGRVLRCAVVRLRPSFVHYRGAIAFDRSLPWFVDESRQPVDDHEARTAHPQRALATPEVI
ncbi:MAG TPA: PilZ domain-containing protein [Vicinamibacterales bacterium]|nr:PilZ domain-containing protein [Vicinamibacterales bacterium]